MSKPLWVACQAIKDSLGRGLKRRHAQTCYVVLLLGTGWGGASLALLLPLILLAPGAVAKEKSPLQMSRRVTAPSHGLKISALSSARLGYPSRRRGGGSRSSSAWADQPFAVVMSEGSGPALTVDSQPSVTFYVAPEQADRPVEVVLENG